MGSERLLGRDFVLMWQGQLVSQLGNQAFLVATLSWSLEATGSPALMGLFMMCSTLPALVVGPVAGAIADRHSRRAIIVGADLLRGSGHLLLAGALAFAPDALGLIVPLLLALALASSALGALLSAALTAAIPELVPPGKLTSANALQHATGQTATLVGQAVGGIAYVWLGPARLVLFDGLTFIASAACTSLARLPGRATAPAGDLRDKVGAYARDVRDGVVWVWRRSGLRALVLAFAAVNLLFTPVFVLLPVYVKDVLAAGPEWYGWLLAAAGAGAVAGAALAPSSGRSEIGLAASLFGIGACTAALGACRSAPLALALLAAIGLLSGLLNVRVITRLQASTPSELRGRVMAVTVALAGSAVPFGLALGGVLGEFGRPFLTSLVSACGVGILAVAAAVANRPSVSSERA